MCMILERTIKTVMDTKQSPILTIPELLKKNSFTPSDLNNVNISEGYINEENFNNSILNNILEELTCISLINCPRCNNEPVWVNLGNLEKGYYVVGCEQCPSYTPCYNSEDSVALHWNLKASPSYPRPIFPWG